jgi:hypothetical protein
MKKFEKSALDKKVDASGKYGKEGSKKDIAADKKAVKNINAGKAPAYKKGGKVKDC